MTQDITIYRADYQPTLDDVIKAWLHAKATHSNSVKTEQAYRENFQKFRVRSIATSSLFCYNEYNLIRVLF